MLSLFGLIYGEQMAGVAFNEKLLGAFTREEVDALRKQFAGEITSEDAVEAAYQAEVKAKKMQMKAAKEGAKAGKDLAEHAAKVQDEAQPLQLSAVDVPEQVSGLMDDLIPPSPSTPVASPASSLPATPGSFGHGFGLDEEELARGLSEDSSDGDDEAEEGVPPAAAVAPAPAPAPVPAGASIAGYADEDWDDV